MLSRFENFIKNQSKVAVVGLGYVGLPLACEFGKRFPVIGFDISQKKINELTDHLDVTGELSQKELAATKVQYTADPTFLSEAEVIIVSVPTPIDQHNQPDLSPLCSASTMIGRHLQKGAVVVYESTVYPGVTEEVCVPILESQSGLVFGQDFTVGYSPERISPGDKERTLTKIIKVVSGSDPATLQFLSQLYGSIIPAGIHEASSIKVAEAAKVIENTQRDLNVALMNELSIIFNKMGISTHDVLAAAGTKWNFIKMTPGLVGGHCIGVDPYYLTFKAQELGYHPEVILAGRRINDSMGKYIAEQTVKLLIKADKQVKGARILIMGITFKENVSDIRNSKVVDIIRELEAYGINVLVTDPLADPDETAHEYGIKLVDFESINQIEAVVFAVNHRHYLDQGTSLLGTLSPSVVVDIKGAFSSFKQKNPFYWVL
ncbi:MAG: nucleotide sugar dehydrogenase [Candidatus Margulisbacteria bacterium]|nr:nucleotide sugar dehydrogenase [Candidatus Margulisiibacteriota bacterium]